MKKILSLGLVLLLMVSLVACAPKGYFDIEDKVKQDYIDTYASGDDGTTIYDIKINSFYGIYDGSFVAIFHQRDKGGFGHSYTINLGGVEFSLPNGDYIRVWKNNKFYEAEEAYEKKLLTLEDVKTIHSLHTADSNNEYYRFYGSYNGANVYYRVNKDKMPKTVEIVDEEFNFIEGGDITVYKGNNTFNLEEDIDEILSEDILKEKNITTIKSIHDKLNQDQELYELKVQSIDQFKSFVEEKDTTKYSDQSVTLFDKAISAFSSCTNNAFTKGEVDWIKEMFETLINEAPTLDLDIENRVKQAYYDTYLSGVSSQTVDDVVIDKYLGTYNGSYVVKFNEITQSRTSYYNEDKWDELSLMSLTYNNVKVWNNGVMYTIEQAYDMGLIVGENLYLIIRLD